MRVAPANLELRIATGDGLPAAELGVFGLPLESVP
jgi:hypothetical protein